METVEVKSYCINAVKVLGNSNKVGEIHSIFRNSINLSFGERLINISANELIKPPFGVQLEDHAMNYIVDNVSKNDCVLWDSMNNRIIFIGMNLRLKFNERYYQSQITNIQIDYSNFVDNISDLIEFAVASNLQNGFDKDMMEVIEFYFNRDKAVAEEFHKELRLLESSLLDEKLEPEILNYWIGRGRGLTPSGDDLLVGILALQSTLGHASKYIKDLDDYLLKEGYKRTTRIGFEYLWYASQNRFSMNTIALCKAMVEGDKKEFKKALWNLSLCGHTSGADTILGIILSSKLIIGNHKDTLD